ncbi:MAG: MutS protein msh4 [Candelina submexicana]|nr:MAG: MutS protein msh4 [Candelina submexicana]
MTRTSGQSLSYSSGTTSYPSFPGKTTTTTTSRLGTGRTSTARPRTAGRPRTTASALSGSNQQQIICAVSESRGVSPTVGLAFVNLSTAEAVLCQICDNQHYARLVHKLLVFDPSQILIMSTAASPKSKMYSIVEENLTGIPITLLDRKYWAETTGIEYITQLAPKEDVEALKVAVGGNYFATCCIAAVGCIILKSQSRPGTYLLADAQLIIIRTKQSVQTTEQAINNVVVLKHFLNSVDPIFEALTGARTELLREIREAVCKLCAPTNIETVQQMIGRVINDDVTYSSQPLDLRNQRTYAIKSGVNGLLDVARQTYKEANADVYQLVSELGQHHEIALELRFDNSRQFYIRVATSELEGRTLPTEFINVFRKSNNVECQTLDLVKRNQKILDSHVEVLLMTDKAVHDLIEEIRGEISLLFKVSEGIAMLDLITSFAQLVTTQNYVRPEFTDTIAVKQGRHPVREKVHTDRYVPNDVYATQQTRFQIITGAIGPFISVLCAHTGRGY